MKRIAVCMMMAAGASGMLGAAQPATTALVNVDVASVIGPIKRMNAVNNGPAVKKPGGDQVRGNFEDYKAARIPFARTHARFDQLRLRRRAHMRHQCDLP